MPALAVSISLVLAILVISPLVRRAADRALNGVFLPSLPLPSERARALHRRIPVADMHCDALLWNRNILHRATRGHVDLPRLREGGVALQVFAASNRFPIGANYRRTPAGPDWMPLIAVANRWPLRAWVSPLARAHAQAAALHRAVAASSGRLSLLRCRAELETLTPDSVGALLLIEGLHGLRGDLRAVDGLFDAGFRAFGIAHMGDNAVGGSAHGWRQGGLTDFGRRVVRRIHERGGVIDLAHASARTIEDVLADFEGPVMISHTGVRGSCPGPRNVSDDVLAAIGERNGFVGVAFFPAAVCGRDARSIARALRHASSVAGVDRVGLGSDFDGAVRVPFDSAHLALLTQALLDDGVAEVDVEKLMGRNARRFLLSSLPVSPAP
jgi:membrane dipeptidase